MKNIKENIVYILLGFTFVISIYSTIKLTQLEDEISKIDLELKINNEYRREVFNKLTQLEDEISNKTTFIFSLIDETNLEVRNISSRIGQIESDIYYMNLKLKRGSGIR